ncbi:Holliday junction endonuclease RuvC [Ectothiorhodosinus mongolicus]|uniref:Crossover junction endodeoxyribonuclease RuvC n=1 Tax=Ectothiorhodosinus mongolicus TaxID=233100 RepID=A0A1R3W133_9GAMM|nr:crossover junction endodeoxyribonuclease RuvC [Ectothiorhodosinus mongolicus]SIT71286.1 Holliday junction endonuclease RuvC [Ectothiorhodosinus mongolicus]
MSAAPLRIIGIDPGSQITGFGILDTDGRSSVHVHSGCIRLPTGDFPQRLGVIFRELDAIIATHQPAVMAIEQAFLARNAAVALKLGQARGAAICAAVNRGLDVSEYAPRLIKQAVVGSGSAVKEQVQHMVMIMLALTRRPAADEADALAAALCHAHIGSSLGRLPQGFQRRRRR